MIIIYTGKITIVASLGAVIALVCLAFIGTLSALVAIVIKYRKGKYQLYNYHYLNVTTILIIQIGTAEWIIGIVTCM